MSEARNLTDIMNGAPVKEEKTLYARATCPCCGRRWFADAAADAFNVHFEKASGKRYGYWACTVTCENCKCDVDDCEFVSEEELVESYKNFGEE